MSDHKTTVPLYMSLASGHTVEYSFEKNHEKDVLIDNRQLADLQESLTVVLVDNVVEAARFAEGVDLGGGLKVESDFGCLPSKLGAVIVRKKGEEPGIDFLDHRSLPSIGESRPPLLCSWETDTTSFEEEMAAEKDARQTVVPFTSPR